MTHSAFRTPHSTLVRLLQLAAPFKGWMALSVLLGALTIGSSIGLMAASVWIIASAALHPSVADLAVAIVGVRFFGIARGVFRYLERLVSHHVNFSLLARLRVWFYSAIEPLAPARLMTYRSGDLLTRIVGDIETLQNFFIRVIAPPLVAIVIALAMAVFLGGYAPSLAAVVLMFMALAGVVIPIGVQRLSRTTGQRLISVRSEMNAQLIDGLQGVSDLIAFGQAGHQSARVKALGRELIRLQRRMASITGLHNALGTLLANLAMWSALIIAIPLVRDTRLSGVDLAVIALATLASFEGVLALPLAFQYLETNLQAAKRLFEIVDDQRPIAAADMGRRGGTIPKEVSAPLRLSGTIHVDALSFRYNAHDPLVLDQINFDLQPGKTLAIVGPSGAGKSTLINLLLRFWDTTDGTITLNGIDLRDTDPDEVRRMIGVVSQTTHLFNTTVRENLLIARPDASEDEIIHAAQQAQIHDFIQSLPQGYDTPIGEQGLKLSGGERQRLAIARALLKNTPIIFLDEPTANLDPITERDVLRALRSLTAQRTTLIATHRLIGLEEADEIIVLRSGRVIERGQQAELLQIDGAYHRMWNFQNQVIASTYIAGFAAD